MRTVREYMPQEHILGVAAAIEKVARHFAVCILSLARKGEAHDSEIAKPS